MGKLRFALFGAGFWARYQLAAWHELPDAECVAIYNRTRSKAEDLARRFGVPAAYDDPEELLAREQLDFVDIVTDVDSHARFALLAAEHALSAICQKPLAPTLAIAESMAAAHREAGTQLLVHENWRWQAPMRALKGVLDEGRVGVPFRARIDMVSGFAVFANQPFLRELDQFVLTDVGTHVLDVARFLFGEAESLYCLTRRVHADIRGEDVATVILRTRSKVAIICELGYAENFLERERFPETFAFVEADRGSVELSADYWLRVTTADGTLARRVPPRHYPWADPAYSLVHASIVDCHRNLLDALLGRAPAETTVEDNLRTLRLVFAAYDSARDNAVVRL